jgi:hypothetical protein
MSTATIPQTLPELYLRAARLIADAGEAGLPLLQGHYRDITTTPPCYCTVGALVAAAGTPATIDAVPLLASAIGFLSPRIESTIVDDDPEQRIADWNDHPDRTVADVVAALLKAARAASPPITPDAMAAVGRHEYDPQDAAYRVACLPTGQAVAS